MSVWVVMDRLSGYHVAGPYATAELAAQALAQQKERARTPGGSAYAERNLTVEEWPVLESL